MRGRVGLITRRVNSLVLAYYNEFDDFAASWLENLIAAGHIANGIVDRRSIRDVQPGDLDGFTQCHFFAGIGGWSLALRLAGWSDTKDVWTGSCPCQPFSAAGKRKGNADERHLWPEFARLIGECSPAIVFGEQVASKDGREWLASVRDDLESMGYAVGAADLCAPGVGAYHIRQRLYWGAGRLALAGGGGQYGRRTSETGDGGRWPLNQADRPGVTSGMGDANDTGPQRRCERRDGADQRTIGAASLASGLEYADHAERRADLPGRNDAGRQNAGRAQSHDIAGRPSAHSVDGLEYAARDGRDERRTQSSGRGTSSGCGESSWRNAEWIECSDGKARPIEPGAQQMADGLSENMGRLRDSDKDQIEAEIRAYAAAAQIDAREAMLDVWLSLGAETLQRTTRGLSSVQSAPVLLALLRQLTIEGWPLAQGLPCPSPKTEETGLRVLWQRSSIARASRKRGLDRQQTGQHSDPVRVLSSILARHAQTAWGEAFSLYAANAFPLIRGAPARVGRLRGYGNAIVPQVAAQFIEAWLECAP